jgi:hypothetical protein
VSKVDADLPAAERHKYLEEVRAYLPAFLSVAATERPDPVGDISDLLNLTRGDLRRVIAVHVALSNEVRDFIASLAGGLRSPITSSDRPAISTQAVRGPIDWSATVTARAMSGWSPATFVVRPAQRVFDTPENRALKWVLERLDVELGRITRAEVDEKAGIHNQSWFMQIAATRGRMQSAHRHHWLRAIPPQRPDAIALRRLQAARTAFYKHRVPDVIALLRRLVDTEPSKEDITDFLCRRYFEPARNWQLYELLVALRLARAIAEKAAGKRKGRLLVGTGRTPFARYVMPDGDEVRLWYQCWPLDVGQSLHDDARVHYNIGGDSSRPDIVVERRRDGTTVDAVVLELKASRNDATLSGGLLQLLGYLKDRPDRFTRNPSAWLVPLPSPTVADAKPGHRELWVANSDDVAAAAVQRLTSPL